MNTPPAPECSLQALRRVLHNMDDHARVMARLFGQGGLPQGLQRHLLDHVAFEEAENERRLHFLRGRDGVPEQLLETLIQHSRLLAELAASTEAMDPELVGELLHHFSEEHGWIQEELAAAGGERPSLGGTTVGSLLGRE